MTPLVNPTVCITIALKCISYFKLVELLDITGELMYTLNRYNKMLVQMFFYDSS